MKIALVNPKAGVGKSTTAVLLAMALHEQGRKVLLVDADRGASCLRWSDLAGGMPFGIVGLNKRTLGRDLSTVVAGGSWDDVLIDVPQMEDHAVIAAGALGWADLWLMPMAPAGIELDRMSGGLDHFDQADATRARPGDRILLLNRCNRRVPSKHGADTQTRQVAAELGFHVLADQLTSNDGLYRQQFGVVPELEGTPLPDIAVELLQRSKDRGDE